MEDININESPESEYVIGIKVVDNVEKVLSFNEQRKGKGTKTLTRKQMLQRPPIALGQVKAGKTSENLLNEIR